MEHSWPGEGQGNPSCPLLFLTFPQGVKHGNDPAPALPGYVHFSTFCLSKPISNANFSRMPDFSRGTEADVRTRALTISLCKVSSSVIILQNHSERLSNLPLVTWVGCGRAET